MNQIEIRLNILVHKLLKCDSFTAVGELEADMVAFIDYEMDNMRSCSGEPLKGRRRLINY
jgi:hypothetical protein